MTNYIKTFNSNSPEYARLRRAAEILTTNSPKGYHYYVGDTYFDFGQDWVWTTILCDGGDYGGYQALTPIEQEHILTGDIKAAVNEVFSNKFCPDRIASEDRIKERNDAAIAGLVAMYGDFTA